jgi:hypothetical protein
MTALRWNRRQGPFAHRNSGYRYRRVCERLEAVEVQTLSVMRSGMFAVFIMLLGLSAGAAGYAGEADVTAVEVKKTGEGTYHFHVTVSHHDEGWKHYADRWDIVAPDDSILGTRTLYHPHVDEQPFTRSLPEVKIHDGIRSVSIRAHDSVHGYGGKTLMVDLPRQ